MLILIMVLTGHNPPSAGLALRFLASGTVMPAGIGEGGNTRIRHTRRCLNIF